MQMTRIAVTAVARADWPGYFIPGNSVEVRPDPQRPGDVYRVLGTGIDPETKEPRATYLKGGEPRELDVDEMLLKHLQADELVHVRVIGPASESPAAKAAAPAGSPPSSRAK